MSSRARRPYLMDKKSVTQFYQAPVRYLAESVNRESEFEKPYVDDSYRPMHFDFPWPDWPPFPELPPWPPLPPIDGPVLGLPGCGITCYPPHMDCDNPVWCHPSIWCGADIGCTLCTWVVEGAVKGYSPHGENWGIDIWIDDELVEEDGKALISACMTDPCGNVCCEDIEITCKVCPPDIAITWDDVNSAETIGVNDTAIVYIKDGLGPYKWKVSGTGFSMKYPESVGVSNVLESDNTACGSATITVTDYCGDIEIGYVRCTNGAWVEIERQGSYHGPPQFDENCIIGKYKYFDDVCCADPGAYTCDEGPWARHCFIATGCGPGGSLSATEHYIIEEWQCP